MIRLGLDRLWLVLALGLPVLVSLLVPLPAVDLAYQVRAGDAILATGAIPGVDTWTFTVAGMPWVDQQWLAQVALAIGFRLGGWELLVVVRAVLVAGVVGLVIATAMARGAETRTAAIIGLLGFLLAAPALALRPQLLAIALFAAMLWLVAVRDRRPGLYLLAPVLVVVWANVHGSVILAPLVLGYAWLDDLARHRPSGRALAVLVVGTLATLVNPFGPGLWSYAAGIGLDPEIAGRVTEWQRTSPLTAPGLLFYGSVIAAAAIGVVGRRRLAWPDWVWLVGMAAIGTWTVRGLAWWPIGAAPVVAAALAIPVATVTVRPRATALNGVVAIAIGIAIIAALPWWRPADPLAGRVGDPLVRANGPCHRAPGARHRGRPGRRPADLGVLVRVVCSSAPLLHGLAIRALPARCLARLRRAGRRRCCPRRGAGGSRRDAAGHDAGRDPSGVAGGLPRRGRCDPRTGVSGSLGPGGRRHERRCGGVRPRVGIGARPLTAARRPAPASRTAGCTS